MSSRDAVSRVVEYWNREQLSSLDSSTSHGDPDLSALDNTVENRRLADLLMRREVPQGACLDVGAGFGRFTSTLGTMFDPVVLLEPAPSLYSVLEETYTKVYGVVTHPVRFEDFTTPTPFAAIVASGVLYFYDDDALKGFLDRTASMLAPDGVLVIRDFIAANVRTIRPSAYVEGASCHYRTVTEWAALARQSGLTLAEVTPSKPPLRWIRRPRVLRALAAAGFTRLFRSQRVGAWLDKISGLKLRGLPIETVFLIMRPLDSR